MSELKCKICGKESSTFSGLSLHVVKSHNIDKKTYYTKYMGNPVGICPCGKETTFKNIVTGFDKFCSIKCSANAKETHEKYAETCIKKYGVDSASKTIEYKESIKAKTLSKFGVESVFQSSEFKEKSKNTCLEKYGTERASQSDVIKDKIKETCIDKYGVEYTIQLPSAIEGRSNVLKSKFGDKK